MVLDATAWWRADFDTKTTWSDGVLLPWADAYASAVVVQIRAGSSDRRNKSASELDFARWFWRVERKGGMVVLYGNVENKN